MSDAVRGRVLWYELLTTDVDAAEKFYTAVVGWTTTPFDGSPERYDMWVRDGGVPVGGVMPIPKGMNFPPHWGMYVGVPVLEDAVSQIERLGGSALSPVIDVPTVGRMRTMLDPQGAAFSIYQPAAPPKLPEAEPVIGDVSWHELYMADAEAALRFYSEMFGWRHTESMDMGDMGGYTYVREQHRARRDDEQAAADGARAAALGAVLPSARRARGRRSHQGQRRPGAERPDGSARRRLDRERHGSARRGVLTAPQEVVPTPGRSLHLASD